MRFSHSFDKDSREMWGGSIGQKEKKYQQAKDRGVNWKGPGSPSWTQPVDESLDSHEQVMWALGKARAEHKEKTFTRPSGNVWRAQHSGGHSPGLTMPWQYRPAPGNLEARGAPVPSCHRYCSTGWHHRNFRVLSLASSRSQQPPVGDAMARAGGSREAERSDRKWPEWEPFVSTQNSKSP